MPEEVVAALVVVIGIVHLAVVLARVGLVVVVAVETIGVGVGLHVVHEEGLVRIGNQVSVAVGLGPAVVVLVLPQEYAVEIISLAVVAISDEIADAPVGESGRRRRCPPPAPSKGSSW